jgi:hypothetical protein
MVAVIALALAAGSVDGSRGWGLDADETPDRDADL